MDELCALLAEVEVELVKDLVGHKFALGAAHEPGRYLCEPRRVHEGGQGPARGADCGVKVARQDDGDAGVLGLRQLRGVADSDSQDASVWFVKDFFEALLRVAVGALVSVEVAAVILDVEFEWFEVDVKEAALAAGSQRVQDVHVGCAVSEKLKQVGCEAHFLTRPGDHCLPACVSSLEHVF